MIDRIRVLIIDEHPAVCQALSTRLAAVPTVTVVGSECDFNDGLAGARDLRPDVILVELKNINEKNGKSTSQDPTAIISSLLACCCSGVIVLTSYPDEQERSGALAAGARRYLLKDIDTVRLVAEIEAVAGEVYSTIRRRRPPSDQKDDAPQA